MYCVPSNGASGVADKGVSLELSASDKRGANSASGNKMKLQPVLATLRMFAAVSWPSSDHGVHGLGANFALRGTPSSRRRPKYADRAR